MEKAVQYFSDEYLETCKEMSAEEIIEFLETYRQLHFDPGPLKQINLRLPENILIAFKAKAAREGMLYQHKIRELITEWAIS